MTGYEDDEFDDVDDDVPYGFHEVIEPLICGFCGQEISDYEPFAYCQGKGGCNERICCACWEEDNIRCFHCWERNG